VAVIPNHAHHDLGFSLIGETSQPKENDSTTRALLPEDQLAKVFVGCHQQSILLAGKTEDGFIGNPGVELRDVEDLMAIFPKPYYDRTVYTLVSEELQAASWESG
jgi:hypothetical protein